MYSYQVFDLHITSDVVLPLPVSVTAPGAAAVHITQGAVLDQLPEVKGRAALFELNERQFLYKLPGIATYLVEDGKRISYRLADGEVDQQAVITHLLGSVMGALLHQRGLLVLHASAVDYHGAAIVFGGVSGAGKSTITKQLQGQGHPLLSDDITVVRQDDNGYRVLPGYPFSRLWSDSMDALELPSEGLETSMKSQQKFIVPAAGSMGADAVPLRSLVSLRMDGSEDYHVRSLKGGEAIHAIDRIMYRRKIRHYMEGRQAYFRLLADTCRGLELQAINRPFSQWKQQGLLDLMRNTYGQ